MEPKRGDRCFLIILLLSLLPGILSAQEGWSRLELSLHESGILYGASSELEDPGPGEHGRYGPEQLLDFDPYTAWSEGAPGSGLGEVIYISLEPGTTALGLRNGFARSQRLFEANNRPQFLKVTPIGAINLEGFATEYFTLFDGKPLAPSVRLPLEDRRTPQRVELPFDWSRLEAAMHDLLESDEVRQMRFPQAREMGAGPEAPVPMNSRYILKLEVNGVYEGNRWADCCIADLWPDYGPVNAVDVSDDETGLVAYTEAGYGIEVYQDENAILEIAAVSPESEWVVMVASPREMGRGRVATDYRLINVATGKDLTETLVGESSPLLLGFESGDEAPRVLVGGGRGTRSARCELYPFNEAPR